MSIEHYCACGIARPTMNQFSSWNTLWSAAAATQTSSNTNDIIILSERHTHIYISIGADDVPLSFLHHLNRT